VPKSGEKEELRGEVRGMARMMAMIKKTAEPYLKL
jgi:hypothetical protein